MGMSSTISNIRSALNSGLTQQMDQQGPGDVSIGMPYGPGYTQPGQQGPGDLTGQIGMPAGPGYMQPSTGGGKNMPAMMPDQGTQPMFNLPNPVTPPGPIDLTGQLGMPAGPGFMQPGQTTKAAMTPQDLYNQHANIIFGQPSPSYTPDFGQPQIGMPAGPGYQQPTPLPSPTVKAQSTPLPPMTPQNVYNQYANTIFGQPTIGMPAGPGFMQPKAAPKPAPITKPIVRPAPIPQTRQQIVEQVGIRQNQKAPTKVQPSLSTRPTGRIGRR